MKNINKFIAVLLCLSIVMLCGCNNNNKPADEQTLYYGFKFPAVLYEGISVDECYLYSGIYPEDGSFAPCENVVALKVKNATDKDIQLMRISVTTNLKTMEFNVTTLLAGSTVVVLEKSKQTMSEDEKILSIKCVNKVDFTTNVSLCEDVFVVQGNLATINIKNISKSEIESDIYVYYKRKDADGNYFGGITFRTKVEGIKPDEIKQLPAANFDPQNSEVLFVDYAK